MTPTSDLTSEWVVDFPTLWIVPDWIERHCPIPDQFRAGEPLELYPWQLWCTVNHYRVKPTATLGQLATAFWYRRTQIVAPQKCGKGPYSATLVCAEAAGPVVFAGWARGGELYRCRDHGCGCGWWYEYQPGEPMGRPWPTPLIQLTATSADQIETNVYRPLKSMIQRGPLSEIMRVGEEFIRVGTEGRIDAVTSSALSRLGNPVNFVLQDETGTYTASNKLRKVAETQRRGLAGMGGRGVETTNTWNPNENSVAQTTAASRRKDIFRYHPQAPADLDFKSKRDRRRIFAYVYAGSSHVDLDAIEAEAAELIETDPAQAERFFGNRIVAGSNTWLDKSKWVQRRALRLVPDRTRIVLAIDGSDVDDWTVIRAETLDGYQFTPTFSNRPTIWNPAEHGGQVPRLEVDAALDELMTRYDVVRVYADPPYWETEIDRWIDRYGDSVVIRWYTRRLVQMHEAAERLLTDVTKADTTWSHDGCATTEDHVGNARVSPRPGGRYVLEKAGDQLKIDSCVTSILVHEAACDAIAAGLATVPDNVIYTASSTRRR